MEPSLSALLNLYVFPTGRRLFALRRVAEVAQDAGFTKLASHCIGALSQDRKCLALERQWAGITAARRGKGAAAPPAVIAVEPSAIDPLVDATLTAIRDHAQNQTAGSAHDDPIRATVASFLQEIFPSGLHDVTGLPFVEELAAVDDILAKLDDPKLKSVVNDLGLARLVKRLGMLAEQFRAALAGPPPEVLAFGEVKAARAAGQDNLLQAVAIVLGEHHKSTPEDTAARALLLGPILEQNDAIGALMRARRAVNDVHPETGAPDPGGASPTDPAAGTGTG